jgi:hypothetical protein
VIFKLRDAMAVLERTPLVLRDLLDGLPDVFIRATEGEGTWSPYDVVGHLIHGERADWLVRARQIVAGDPTPFEPFDRTAQFRDSQGKTLAELVAIFGQLRQANLSEVHQMHLAGHDLTRTGQHPEFGAVTLEQLLATWVVHDLDHLAQIARTTAKVYTEAVGPWSAYLSILRDRTRA